MATDEDRAFAAYSAALRVVVSIHDAREACANVLALIERGTPEGADIARSLERANDDASALLRLVMKGVRS